jgi:uncharacterized membrane protein
MKLIGRWFFNGLLFLVPIVASIYTVYAVFVKVDGLLGIPIPGAGFVITLGLITFIGFLAGNFLTRWLFRLTEKLFTKLPFVKVLYTSIKDLIGAFIGDKKRFDKPVLFKAPGSGAKVLGFITREDLAFLGQTDHVAVYFPQSYNFAGNMLICPASEVEPISADSGDVMAFIVSGGVTGGDK